MCISVCDKRVALQSATVRQICERITAVELLISRVSRKYDRLIRLSHALRAIYSWKSELSKEVPALQLSLVI